MEEMLAAVERMLVASDFFMDACNLDPDDVDDVAEALADRIFRDYFADEQLIPDQALAVIIDETGTSETQGAGSATNPHAEDRAVVLLLCRPAEDGAHKVAKRAFLTWIDSVMEELADLCGVTGYYPIQRIEKMHEVQRVKRMERAAGQDFFWVRYRLVGDQV